MQNGHDGCGGCKVMVAVYSVPILLLSKRRFYIVYSTFASAGSLIITIPVPINCMSRALAFEC